MKKWQHQQQFKTRFSLIKNSESFEGCRSRSAFRVRKTQSSIIPDTSFLERVMNELSYNFIFQISFVTFFALQGRAEGMPKNDTKEKTETWRH